MFAPAHLECESEAPASALG